VIGMRQGMQEVMPDVAHGETRRDDSLPAGTAESLSAGEGRAAVAAIDRRFAGLSRHSKDSGAMNIPITTITRSRPPSTIPTQFQPE